MKKIRNEPSMNHEPKKGFIRLSGNESFEGRLKAVCDLYEKNILAAGQAQISTDQLRAYISGKSKASLEPVARLAEGKGVNLNWLWSGVEPIFLSVVEEYGSVNEEKTNTYDHSVSHKDLLDKYNNIDHDLKQVCDRVGFSPSTYIQDMIKTMMFSDQLTDQGLIVLIKALKVDYELVNPSSNDQTM